MHYCRPTNDASYCCPTAALLLPYYCPTAVLLLPYCCLTTDVWLVWCHVRG
jgi:hypothetical protein